MTEDTTAAAQKEHEDLYIKLLLHLKELESVSTELKTQQDSVFSPAEYAVREQEVLKLTADCKEHLERIQEYIPESLKTACHQRLGLTQF